MRKADAPDTACSRAGTRLSPLSCQGRAGAVQPGECGHSMPGLPMSHPHPCSSDKAAVALLTASLQGLGRRLRGWGIMAGRICLVSKHPWQLKLCWWYGRGSESWSFDGGLGSGRVGLGPLGLRLQPPASSLLLPVGSPVGPPPHPAPHRPTPSPACVGGEALNPKPNLQENTAMVVQWHKGGSRKKQLPVGESSDPALVPEQSTRTRDPQPEWRSSREEHPQGGARLCARDAALETQRDKA